MTITATEQIIRGLTLRQASGKSCVCCGKDYLPSGRPGRVQVGMSESGQKIYACRMCPGADRPRFPGPREAVRHEGFPPRRSPAEQAWHRVHGPGQRGRAGSGRDHDEDAAGDRHGPRPTTNRRAVSRPALLTGSPVPLAAVAPGSYELAADWVMHVRLVLAAAPEASTASPTRHDASCAAASVNRASSRLPPVLACPLRHHVSN